jgi:hypothetical protein
VENYHLILEIIYIHKKKVKRIHIIECILFEIFVLAITLNAVFPYHDLRNLSRLFKDNLANRLLCKLLEGKIFLSLKLIIFLYFSRIGTPFKCNINWITK